MNLAHKIQQAEKNVQTYQKLAGDAQVKYNNLRATDTGLHKNHWELIERARKDLQKLLDGKRHWVKKLFTLEKQLKQSMISH